MHYEAVSCNEVKVNKKQERHLFIYQVIFVIVIITLAFVKEKFFASDIRVGSMVMQNFNAITACLNKVMHT
jgi:hypothetical protein